MKILYLTFFFAFTLQLPADTLADVFASVEGMESLVYNQATLINEMNFLLRKLEGLIVMFKRDTRKIYDEYQLMQRDPNGYVSNPLNAVLLIKTLSFDITQTKNRILGVAEEFRRETEKITLPHSDFEGAVDGLVRLQTVYDLKAEDLAKGIIQGKKYRNELTANDLFAIGQELMKSNLTSAALSYLNLASEKNLESFDMPQLEILDRIYHNNILAGNSKAVVETIDKILELSPTRTDLEDKRIYFELKATMDGDFKKEEIIEDKKDGKLTAFKEFKLSNKACRNELKKSDSELSKLYCRYVWKTDFSKIAPFKVEELNLDPYITLYYDVISDNEIKLFKSLSKPSLNRAQVLNLDSTSRVDKVRVAKLSWHYDKDHEIFNRLTKRVGDMTGLNMKSADNWQGQNYGIGGHYALHWDYTVKGAAPFTTGNGNRIATALFYLSNVEKGGATIFPYLRITVQPIKGAAILWYNLSTSGDQEHLTKHSGCPVLVGSKWAANKWIHEYEQEWTRPCGLKPVIPEENYYKDFF